MNKPAAPAPARRGRPALTEGAESAYVGIRLTPAQKEKLQRLGGAAWIRERIEKAR